VLKGEYGATPAKVNSELQQRVLQGAEPVSCRPADLLAPELEHLRAELAEKALAQGLSLSEEHDDDVLTYALFPQIGLQFIKNRGNPAAFEPKPELEAPQPQATQTKAGGRQPEVYTVDVQGQRFVVQVSEGGDINQIAPLPVAEPQASPVQAPAVSGPELEMSAPLSGNIFKVQVVAGDSVRAGDVVIILEAMKMETEIRAQADGVVSRILVKEGDAVSVGTKLLALA
jgi:oxaloacetate decarboxylase alpha subunit